MFRNNLICIRRGYYVVCKDSWGPCHSVLLCPFLTSKMKTVKIPHSAPQHNMHIVQDCFALWGQYLSKIEFNLCTISSIYFCEFTIFFFSTFSLWVEEVQKHVYLKRSIEIIQIIWHDIFKKLSIKPNNYRKLFRYCTWVVKPNFQLSFFFFHFHVLLH